MSLGRVQVTDFRCLPSAVLDFDSRFTLISGANASGKTTLLESIYVLGRGRSFRTPRLEHLIRRGSDRFIVFGEVHARGRRVTLGVEGAAAGVRARIGGDRVRSLAELASQLPVQIIDPDIHRLIEEGPGRRRRFLDWGVFHVEPQFIQHWNRFRLVLKQRNAALRAGHPRPVAAAWDADLVRCGEAMSAARCRYLDLLLPHAIQIVDRLLGMDLTVSYRSGWASGQSLTEALLQCWIRDQESGVTQVGPHRAELSIRLNGLGVKDRISRGQQKLLAAALLVAQIRVFPPDSPVQPTLLLDDPAAELDNLRIGSLIEEVSSQSTQLIVTTLHPEFAEFGIPGRHYRVADGQVFLA